MRCLLSLYYYAETSQRFKWCIIHCFVYSLRKFWITDTYKELDIVQLPEQFQILESQNSNLCLCFGLPQPPPDTHTYPHTLGFEMNLCMSWKASKRHTLTSFHDLSYQKYLTVIHLQPVVNMSVFTRKGHRVLCQNNTLTNLASS